MVKKLKIVKIKMEIQVSGWVCDKFEMEGSWEIVKEAMISFYENRQLERKEDE